MKPKIQTILAKAIEDGIDYGWHRGHKYSDTPDPACLKGEIENAIWLAIYEVFEFGEGDENV